MANKQSKTRDYKIYAFYNSTRRIAFLGKSYAETLAPIYSKHICGKNIYTKNHFGKTAPLVVPQLSILEHVIGTYREAYRHLVAWCRVFLDAGYTMLTQKAQCTTLSHSTLPQKQSIVLSVLHRWRPFCNKNLANRLRSHQRPQLQKSNQKG